MRGDAAQLGSGCITSRPPGCRFAARLAEAHVRYQVPLGGSRFHREDGRSGVVRAQICGFALPPARVQHKRAALISGSPRKKYFLFRSSEAKMRSSSHDSRSPRLPVKSRRAPRRAIRKEATRDTPLATTKRRHVSFCKRGAVWQPRVVMAAFRRLGASVEQLEIGFEGDVGDVTEVANRGDAAIRQLEQDEVGRFGGVGGGSGVDGKGELAIDADDAS